jgi:uncharacterized protein
MKLFRIHRGPASRFAVYASLMVLAAGTVIHLGCSRIPEAKKPAMGDPLLRERREKDLAFKSNSSSPIPEADRPHFQGLAYFDINPDLRFRVKLIRYAKPERIRIGTNTGEVRSGLRYGYFEFEVKGQVCRLQVYRLEELPGGGSGPELFVPFRDATTGKTTYGAGRYIDFKENTSGIYDLDFNRAYNPSCAYGGDYSCPTPPPENTLSVPIEAGERNYPLAKAQGHNSGFIY